ncbi:MAG: glycosyltransferase family 2 protein [Candidatus Nanosalina sp.]
MTPKNEKIKASVIIPAYREAEMIGDTLDSLEGQNAEIIVVAYGEETREIAQNHTACDRVLEDKGEGPSAARNKGAEAAEGEILVFTDADTLATENWVEKHLQHYSDSDVVCVGGTAEARENGFRSIISDLYAMHLLPVIWKAGPNLLIGNNCSFRKKDFLKIGGFNTEMDFLEDVEIAQRISDRGRVVLDMDIATRASIRRIKDEGVISMVFTYCKGFWNYFLTSGEPNEKYHRNELHD